jgi:hypothetical protein
MPMAISWFRPQWLWLIFFVVYQRLPTRYFNANGIDMSTVGGLVLGVQSSWFQLLPALNCLQAAAMKQDPAGHQGSPETHEAFWSRPHPSAHLEREEPLSSVGGNLRVGDNLGPKLRSTSLPLWSDPRLYRHLECVGVPQMQIGTGQVLATDLVSRSYTVSMHRRDFRSRIPAVGLGIAALSDQR